MADVITNSNRDSSLINALQSVSTHDPMRYSLSESLPNNGMEIVKLSPATALSGTSTNEVKFRLPPNQFLVDGFLKYSAAAGSTNSGTVSAYRGAMAFSEFRIDSRDGSLQVVTPEVLVYDALSRGSNAEIANKKLAMGGSSALTASATTDSLANNYYVPLGGLFALDSPQQAYDCRFFQELSLVCKPRTVSEVDGRGSASHHASDALTLYAKYVKYDEESYKEYVNSTFKNQSKLQQRLSWSIYDEDSTGGTSVAVTQVVGRAWNCPHVITETFIFVRDNTEQNTNKNLFSFQGIKSLTIRGNGREIYKCDDMLGSNLCMHKDQGAIDVTSLGVSAPTAAQVGIEYAALSHGAHNIVKIDWRLQKLPDEENMRDSFTGGLAAGAMSSKNFDVDFIDGGNSRVYMQHRISQLVQIDSRNGGISVSARS